jgi:hypothetical protein
MCARKAAETPFDRILGLAQHAGTVRARDLMHHISDEIEGPVDVPQWARAIQLARDVGAVGATECYALLDIVTEEAMGFLTRTDSELHRLADAMRSIATADGLSDDEDYYLDEAPAEWLELNRQWDRRFDQLRADLFRRIGEPGMADELLLFQETFEARSQEGRSALFDVADDDDTV